MTPILMKIELKFEYIINRLQLKIHIKILSSLAIINDFIKQIGRDIYRNEWKKL